MKRLTALVTALLIILTVFPIEFKVKAEVFDPDYIPVQSEKYNSPTILPPADTHPRLMFREEDTANIKANFKGINTNAYNEYLKLLNYETEGTLPEGKFNEKILASIEARGFCYALDKNTAVGNAAVSQIKNLLNSYVFSGSDREAGYILFISSEIYDWCYDLISDEDKKMIADKCIFLLGKLGCRWPFEITIQGSVTGAACEAMVLRDAYSFAIAVYDEYPDIYNYVQSYIEKEYVPVRNEWSKSSSFWQGTSYGPLRYSFDMWAAWFAKRMSGADLYSSDMQKPLYQMLYYDNPAGFYIREGDDTPFGVMHGRTVKGNVQAFWLASNYYNDPYLKAEQLRLDPEGDNFSYNFSSMSPVQFLIINNPEIEPGDVSELPKTKFFGSPNGFMVARTGWETDNIDSSDAVVLMRIGEEYMANHQHLDFGTFSIYYKGNLTGDLGMYRYYGSDHDFNYNKETISRNGLLIYDPDEKPVQATVNSGGQRRINTYLQDYNTWKHSETTYGEVTGHSYDEKNSIPEYSYISGDITNAYSDKVSEVKRSMMFMPTDNPDKPAVFFVMDKIVSKKAGFKKTFLLQCMQEPNIEGNVIEIIRNHPKSGFNGKLTVQPLFPKNVEITKQGGPGYQWYAGGRNIVALDNNLTDLLDENNLTYGWGKVLVSPQKEQKEDFFLNAMYVSDADSEAPVSVATSFETDKFIGAELENKTVIFAKTSERMSEDFSIDIPGTESTDIAVMGINCGNWKIYKDGRYLKTLYATREGGMIYFKGEGGSYAFEVEKQLDAPEITEVIKNNIGCFEISWLPSENAVGYKVEVLSENEMVYTENVNDNFIILPENLSDGREYSVSLTALSNKEGLTSDSAKMMLDTSYGGGFGTAEYPYIITNSEEFLNISKKPYGNFRLVADITRELTTPINEFYGKLTGWDKENDKEIQRTVNVDINLSDEKHLGLFRNLSGAEIKNLKITGKIRNGFRDGWTGGLVGNSISCKFVNITNEATMEGTLGSPVAGGIAGYAQNSDIFYCANKGDITCNYIVGGIVGWSYLSAQNEISNCYNSGNIKSNSSVGIAGGIVGIARHNSIIKNSYNSGNIIAKKYPGGIVGDFHASVNGFGLYGCYTTNSALSLHTDKIINEYSYYLGELTEGNALSEADMKKQASYKNWDFENIWYFDAESGYAYPQLRLYEYKSPVILQKLSSFDKITDGMLMWMMQSDYPEIKGKAGIFISSRISCENYKISEFGFSLSKDNGVSWIYYPADKDKISTEGNFGMYLYSGSEGTYKIRAYAVCYGGGAVNKVYGDIQTLNLVRN